MDTPRSPGQRAGLTHAAVLAAARDLVADSGAEAVTMRALARRLGVAPNALYSHVPNKTALLDELLDDLLSTVAAPDPQAHDPLGEIASLMASTYDLLTAHPDLVPLYLTRQGARGPHAVALGEAMDALLSRAGVAADAVAPARRVLIIHTLGSAAFATGTGATATPTDADAGTAPATSRPIGFTMPPRPAAAATDGRPAGAAAGLPTTGGKGAVPGPERSLAPGDPPEREAPPASGAAAGSDRPAPAGADRPIPAEQTHAMFTRSLRWLLTGIIRDAAAPPTPLPGWNPSARPRS